MRQVFIMAGRLPFLVCTLSLLTRYVLGQVTTSASVAASTASIQPIQVTTSAPVAASTASLQPVPDHVYPPLTVTGLFPW